VLPLEVAYCSAFAIMRAMNGELSIQRLTALNDQDKRDIARLMTMLSNRFAGGVIDDSILERIIQSPHHDQLVARLDSRIVGAATISLVFGAGMGSVGYLQDFVVDSEVRGKGVGDALFQAVEAWCLERNVELEFTSNASKEAAHSFYRKHGAKIRDTTVLHIVPGERDTLTEL